MRSRSGTGRRYLLRAGLEGWRAEWGEGRFAGGDVAAPREPAASTVDKQRLGRLPTASLRRVLHAVFLMCDLRARAQRLIASPLVSSHA